MHKHFKPNQKVLLYDSRLHLFSGKLQSGWTDRYMVKNMYPYCAIDVEDPTNGNTFKENGQRLKLFLKGFDSTLESILLENPVYGVE